MIIRASKLDKDSFVIHITGETKKEYDILDKAKMKFGFEDGTGMPSKKEVIKYWGDTEPKESGIKIFIDRGGRNREEDFGVKK